MAIRLKAEYKGVALNYWAIIEMSWNKLNNLTTGRIVPYVNVITRNADVHNYFGEYGQQFVFEGNLTREEVYKKLMYKPSEKEDLEGREKGFFEDGEAL